MCCWKRGFSVRVKSPPMMGTWSRRCPLGYGAGVSFPRGYPLEVMWGLTFTMFGSSDCKLMKVYRLIAIRPTVNRKMSSCTERAFVFGGSFSSNGSSIR